MPSQYQPGPMNLNRSEWKKRLDISNFVNAYYQLRDVEAIVKSGRILVIGPGQGLDAAIFRWRGFSVTTFDIDETFCPDVVGSAHDLSVFGNKTYDIVIASHVLEHLPIRFFDAACSEMSRVAKHAVVYLPVNGRHAQLRIKPGIRGWHWSVGIDVINPLRRPTGESPEFMSGQHYWEIGLRGFSKRQIIRRMSNYFYDIKCYRNQDWTPSMNFIMTSIDKT